MSDLEEKLEGILGNPDAMKQIMSLAQSLGKSSAAPRTEAADADPMSDPQPAQPQQDGGLLDTLDQIDPRLITAAARLMSQYHTGDDRRVALLTALRPFVKEQRYAKLDKAIQIAKLSRLIRMALELFRPQEEQHV